MGRPTKVPQITNKSLSIARQSDDPFVFNDPVGKRHQLHQDDFLKHSGHYLSAIRSDPRRLKMLAEDTSLDDKTDTIL